MQGMLTVQEIAKLWDVPASQVTRYCRNGRIAGARKEKGVWYIPEEARKPEDKRKNEVFDTPAVRKALPIGVSNYRDACTNYYYIDKTMMIKEFLDERPKVSLFTRPRRFGKTLNMDMLKTFFEISSEDTSRYFVDKQIWKCGAYYRSHQGKYPVIFLSFKDIKCNTWNETYEMIKELIETEYTRHAELAESENVTVKDRYQKIVTGKADEGEYSMALKNLSRMLHVHYGVAPIIIIDEYDTPIQQGHIKDFYEKIIGFMRNFFSGGLKDNDHLSFGFMTGILRVAKESIFSGLNNIKINSILEDKYSQYFGFTAAEVQQMAAYYGASDKYDEVCEWYDGYRFGDTEIFNPWSVINYFGNGCKPGHFWENTGNNTIIGEVLEEADEDIVMYLNDLLQGKALTTYIDTSVIYPEIKNNPSSIYSFLIVSGYLKIWEKDITFSGDTLCRVSLPNKEIMLVYKKEIINRLHRAVPQSVAVAIQEAIYGQDIERLQKQLRRFLLESVSFFDVVNENSYHMLLLGLCALMSDKYYLTSNRESGEGRFDIQLMPKETAMPGILIELKVEKKCSEQELKELSQEALNQIADKQYDAEMIAKGVRKIFKYGVAFSGKQVQISAE